MAYDYFGARSYTRSVSSGMVSTTTRGSSGAISVVNSQNLIQTNGVKRSNQSMSLFGSTHTVSFLELPVVCIPPKSAKFISEFLIIGSYYDDCDLEFYPNYKDEFTKEYDSLNSPFRFSNIISYQLGSRGPTYLISHKFYINRISNFPKERVFKEEQVSDCNGKRNSTVTISPLMAPNRFYHFYNMQPSYSR